MSKWKGIIGRGFTPSEFADYVATLTFDQWRPQFVVVHNTGDPTFAEWHSVPTERRLKGLESYYRDDQGWSAGPHLFIADDKIWVFTPLTTSGVHSPSWNHVSWGVEIVGDYDHEIFRSDVKANVISALVTLHLAIGLDPLRLKFHKEDPLTTHTYCPGTRVSKPDILSALQRALFIETPGEHVPSRPTIPLSIEGEGEGEGEREQPLGSSPRPGAPVKPAPGSNVRTDPTARSF